MHSGASMETIMSLPALLNPHPFPPKTFSLLPTFKISLSTPHFLSLKPSPNSLSTAVQFSLRYQQYDAVDDEVEEHVVGDCLVFEEGIFDDPYLNQTLCSPPISTQTTSRPAQKGKNVVLVEPENLIPEKWLEVRDEINITKKERRKLAQELEFGTRLDRKKQRLRPIGMSVDEFRATKLAEWKPVVLDNPTFVSEEDSESAGDVIEEEVEKDNERAGDGGEVGGGRVAPKNPKLAVYGADLGEVSEFLSSWKYDPEAAKKPEGSRTKLFTKEEKELMNKRVPDLAAATSGKWQPLHTVAASGEFYLVDLLLKHNVDINIPDKDGLTALHKAVLGKKQAIFNYLLRESANPFIRDREGATLMHYAVRTASSPMIKILLLYNVDINLQDNDGWTPLHLAVQSRRTDIVRLLLIKGADKTLKNQDGLTPLDLCLYSGRDTRTYELIRLMKQPARGRRFVIQQNLLTS